MPGRDWARSVTKPAFCPDAPPARKTWTARIIAAQAKNPQATVTFFIVACSRLYDLLEDSEKVKGNFSPRPRQDTGYPDPFNSVLKKLLPEEE
jgi:hypothetical protein